MDQGKIVSLRGNRTRIFYTIDENLAILAENTRLIEIQTATVGAYKHVGGDSH